MRWTYRSTLAEQFSLKEKPAELYALKESSQPRSLGYDEFTTAVIAEKSTYMTVNQPSCLLWKKTASRVVYATISLLQDSIAANLLWHERKLLGKLLASRWFYQGNQHSCLFGKTAANKTDITSDLSLLQDTSQLVRIKENSKQNKLISIIPAKLLERTSRSQPI